MDKRAFLAIALSLGVLILWSAFFAPKSPPPAEGVAPPAKQSSPVSGPDTGSATPLSASSANEDRESKDLAGSTGRDASASAEQAGSTVLPKRESPPGSPRVIVETAIAHVEIERVGSTLRSWTLKTYKDNDGRPYELVPPDSMRTGQFPLQFRLQDKALEGLLNTRASFDVERRRISKTSPGLQAAADTTKPSSTPGGASAPDRRPDDSRLDDGEEIKLVFSDGRGVEAVKTIVFFDDSHLVEVTGKVSRNGKPVPGEIVWGPGLGTPSPDDLRNTYYAGGGAISDTGVGASRVTTHSISGSHQSIQGVRWAGLEEKYFATVFIPMEGSTDAEIFAVTVPPSSPTQPPDASQKSASQPHTRLSVAVPLGPTYLLYAGPKDYGLLSSLDQGLTDLVNFQPMLPLIGPLLGPLIGLLAKFLWSALRWLNSYVPNYGVDIIVLTTVIKIAFYPITQRAMVKMRGEQKKMQRVQPKVNAIKEKYRKLKDAASRAKVNEEVMALYKREGINPMASLGGCLPMLVQLPILYGFLQVLNVSIELRQAPFFGWVRDLSRPDPYYITPILMGISMFAQQRMAMTTVTDPQQRMQQRMMLIMPIIFTYMFLNLPSGLVLYWLVNNILGIVQQVLINRQARVVEAREAAALSKA